VTIPVVANAARVSQVRMEGIMDLVRLNTRRIRGRLRVSPQLHLR